MQHETMVWKCPLVYTNKGFENERNLYIWSAGCRPNVEVLILALKFDNLIGRAKLFDISAANPTWSLL